MDGEATFTAVLAVGMGASFTACWLLTRATNANLKQVNTGGCDAAGLGENRQEQQQAGQLKADQAAWVKVQEQEEEDERKEAERRIEEAQSLHIWEGTGGPPERGVFGTRWIRDVWRYEEHNFTPWLVRELHLVSACTGLELGEARMEVEVPLRGRADIVARDDKSGLGVVIENQLDAADLNHSQRLSAYADGLNARVRIWIAAEFSTDFRHGVRIENMQNKSRPDGAIYYLLRLESDPVHPLVLVEGPRHSD